MMYNRFAIILICFLFSCAAPQAQVDKGPVIYRSGSYAIVDSHTIHSDSDLARIVFGDEKKAWKIQDNTVPLAGSSKDLLAISLTEKNIGGIYENGYQNVPILCYHKFGDKRHSSMNTPARVFRQQMKYLKDNGYRVISPFQMMDFLAYRRQIPQKAVLLTFDDGFRSVFDVAVPILEEFGFTATLFVYTNYIGVSSKALSWADLKVLKSKGFTIGSHSVSHDDLTFKNKDETVDQFFIRRKKELVLSKQILDRHLGQDTLFFSFPYGKYDGQLLKLAGQAGYKLAVTVDRGGNPFFSNPLALKRDMILKKDLKSFISSLQTFNKLSLK